MKKFVFSHTLSFHSPKTVAHSLYFSHLFSSYFMKSSIWVVLMGLSSCLEKDTAAARYFPVTPASEFLQVNMTCLGLFAVIFDA